MNAVARVLTHSSIFSPSDAVGATLSIGWRTWTLFFTVLISALVLLYVKDLNRCLYIQEQTLYRQTELLQVEHNKLLLEQSAWAAQVRVQQIALQQLDMRIPVLNEVVVVKVS